MYKYKHKMRIDYYDFMKNNRVFKVLDNLTEKEALNLLTQKENEFDMISYNHNSKITLVNMGFLRLNDEDKYYYDYIFRDCDIIDNFTIDSNNLDVNFSFMVGRNEFKTSDIKEFLLVSSMYELKLRITFNGTPDINTEIRINVTKYLCKNEIRKTLMNNCIITNSLIYIDGMCLISIFE